MAVDRLDRSDHTAAEASRERDGLGSVAAPRDAFPEYDVLFEQIQGGSKTLTQLPPPVRVARPFAGVVEDPVLGLVLVLVTGQVELLPDRS